jgi:hypothetical protein
MPLSVNLITLHSGKELFCARKGNKQLMECRPRRSIVSSPRNKGVPDVLAPDLLASVLGRQCKQHIFIC